MSKYIIEIEEKPLCVFDKDTQTYFPRLWRVKGFNSLVFDEEGLSRLEVLNSDYINEHFGDLQDTAYQRGLNDAWEAAKKILQMYDFTVFGLEHDGVFESPLNEGQQMTPQEAIEKLKAYEKKQSDKIEVGDEVNWLGDCFVVTRIFQPRNMKEQCDGIDDDGCVYHDVLIKDLEKTGRHFDIASILEDMKHD